MGGFVYGPLSWGEPSLTHGSCVAKKKLEEETDKRRIVDFARDVSEYLVEMALKMEKDEKEQQETDQVIVSVESSETTLSSLTGISNDHKHTREYLSGKKNPATTRTGKRKASQARCMWCSRIDGLTCKTQLRCIQCGVGFCAEKSGRRCCANHVCNDGPPAKQPQQRKKQSRRCTIVAFDENENA